MSATAGEKNQVDRLLSRIDQQSNLITMLKHRVDKTQEEVGIAKLIV